MCPQSKKGVPPHDTVHRTGRSWQANEVRLYYSGIGLLRPFRAWMIWLDRVPLGVAPWPCQWDTPLARPTHLNTAPKLVRGCGQAGLQYGALSGLSAVFRKYGDVLRMNPLVEKWRHGATEAGCGRRPGRSVPPPACPLGLGQGSPAVTDIVARPLPHQRDVMWFVSVLAKSCT